MKYLILLTSLLAFSGPLLADPETDKILLGKLIFHDTRLSEPGGQACASCHRLESGYADQDATVSAGASPGLFGNRNAPGISYVKFNPPLFWNQQEGLWMGGFFLDGRARTLQEQAGGPFLNPLEMANRSESELVEKVRGASYAAMMTAVYGSHIWQDSHSAFNAITDAIVAYENGPDFAPFSSKYDAYLAGEAVLSKQEQLGLEVFEAESKGNCAACHPSQPGAHGEAPLFTDYSYDNLGVPRNPELPFLNMPADYNPAGKEYRDTGLAQNPHIDQPAGEMGKFKVPSLRNVADTAPYMHNGVFSSLEEVVDFYNTRDSSTKWGEAEISEGVNKDELGDLGLSREEEIALVAFLRTLSDGYRPQRSQPLTASAETMKNSSAHSTDKRE